MHSPEEEEDSETDTLEAASETSTLEEVSDSLEEEDKEVTMPEGDLTKVLESHAEQMKLMTELVEKQGKAMDEMARHITTIDKSLEKTVLEKEAPVIDAAEKEKQEILRRRRIPPPVFKGEKGERPEAHLLRAEDWMEAIGIKTEGDKMTNFKLTLDHLAREWYNQTGKKKTSWDSLTTDFSRYFSTQGKSMRNLHFRWNRFKFNPATDDIEEFIRNVQECAAQLAYTDDATMNMIKSCMPKSVYAALYEKETLESVIDMVINLFAKELEDEEPQKAAAASASPFSAIQDGTGPLQDQISKLTDALYNIDVTKPFKPYITPRGRGRGRGRGKPSRGRGQPFQFQGKGNMSFPKPTTRGRGRGRGRGKFDKSPTQRKPRVAPKAKDMDKERCNYCKQLGHWVRDCPEKKNNAEGIKAYDEWIPEDFDLCEDTGLKAPTFPEMFNIIQEEDLQDQTSPTPMEEDLFEESFMQSLN